MDLLAVVTQIPLMFLALLSGSEEEPVSAIWDVSACDQSLRLRAQWLREESLSVLAREHVLQLKPADLQRRWEAAKSEFEHRGEHRVRGGSVTFPDLSIVPWLRKANPPASALFPVNSTPEPEPRDERGPRDPMTEFQIVFRHFADKVPGHPVLKPSSEARVARQLAANAYVGLGVTASRDSGVLVFPTILPGGAAERAGLPAGVRVLAIDGWETANKPMEESLERIRGPVGTMVTLSIQEGNARREIAIRRDFVRIDSVVGWESGSHSQQNWLHPLDQQVAYVKCRQLGSSTVHELRRIEARLRPTSYGALILDLRECFGASDWHSVRLIADALISGGVLWNEVDENGQTISIVADADCLFRDRPMIALINATARGQVRALGDVLRQTGRATLIEEYPQGRMEQPVDSGIAASEMLLALPTAAFPLAGGRWELELPKQEWRFPEDSSTRPAEHYVWQAKPSGRRNKTPRAVRGDFEITPVVELPETLMTPDAVGLAIHLSRAAMTVRSEHR